MYLCYTFCPLWTLIHSSDSDPPATSMRPLPYHLINAATKNSNKKKREKKFHLQDVSGPPPGTWVRSPDIQQELWCWTPAPCGWGIDGWGCSKCLLHAFTKVFQEWPTGIKPEGRPGTSCREFISCLARKGLLTPQEELEDKAAGRDVSSDRRSHHLEETSSRILVFLYEINLIGIIHDKKKCIQHLLTKSCEMFFRNTFTNWLTCDQVFYIAITIKVIQSIIQRSRMCNKIQCTPFSEVLCRFEMKIWNYYEVVLREAQLRVLLLGIVILNCI